MREPATSCFRCGRVLGNSSEIVYSPDGESLCDGCGGSGPLGLRFGSAAMASHLARQAALHRRTTARRRRALTTAIAAAWLLAVGFAAYRVRTLPPMVMIISPASGASVGLRPVVSGSVVSGSLRGSLWLVVRPVKERRWLPQGELLPSAVDGTWQTAVGLRGMKGARYRLGVVTADAQASASFRRRNDDDASRWLRERRSGEQGGVGCRDRTSGPELPSGATLLESIEVVLGEDDGDWAFPPCGDIGYGLLNAELQPIRSTWPRHRDMRHRAR